MGYHDVQQVCLNGHQTTDSYNSYPKFRKDFCSDCGEKTIYAEKPVKTIPCGSVLKT